MGIGKSLKKIAKKVIPKEVGGLAPIVGMFNPALGAMMGVAGGIREGNLMKAAMSGLGAYGLGSFAKGAGMPQFGGGISDALVGGLKNIPGVGQIAGSNLGQGIGSIFKNIQGQGGKFGNLLKTGFTGEQPPVAYDEYGRQIKQYGQGRPGGGGLSDILFGKGNLGITMKDLLFGGAGALESYFAKKDMEKKIAGSGFNKSLAELQQENPLASVNYDPAAVYQDGGRVHGFLGGLSDLLGFGDEDEDEGGRNTAAAAVPDGYDQLNREFLSIMNSSAGGMYDVRNPQHRMELADMLGASDAQTRKMLLHIMQQYLRTNQADGGMIEARTNYNMGGLGSIPQTSMVPQGQQLDGRGGGFIPMGAKERKDDVPAMLAKNEFVMTADAVRAAGGGSINEGAKRMYNMMHSLENQGRG
jgi:hypothetical protein